jgi:hypothetical protein
MERIFHRVFCGSAATSGTLEIIFVGLIRMIAPRQNRELDDCGRGSLLQGGGREFQRSSFSTRADRIDESRPRGRNDGDPRSETNFSTQSRHCLGNSCSRSKGRARPESSQGRCTFGSGRLYALLARHLAGTPRGLTSNTNFKIGARQHWHGALVKRHWRPSEGTTAWHQSRHRP